MKNFIIACKPENLQSKAFKNALLPYTEEKGYEINWTFSSEEDLANLIDTAHYDLVLLSPEVLIYKAKITSLLDEKSVPYVEIKASNYGLKRIEKVIAAISNYI